MCTYRAIARARAGASAELVAASAISTLLLCPARSAAARHWLPPCSALLAGTTPADDHVVGRLGAAGAAFWLACGVDRVATTGGLALSTAVRVVDRVHRDTADGRALALPPHAARLAPV